MQFSSSFCRNVEGAFPEGAAWIASLPDLLAECERRWDMTVADPFPLSFSFVAPAVTRQGNDVVLKIGVPNPELRSEIAALRLYGGSAAVRLLDADEDRGFLLLERLAPGQMLVTVEDDEEGTRIAARIMRELWRPLPDNHTFPTVAQWAKGLQRLRQRFGGGTGPFPPALVNLAESLFDELLASSEPAVLVHGDLHHSNILSAQRRPWIAIDPKGLAAEPTYEVGALLRNPSPRLWSDVTVQRRRIDVLVEELNLDRPRVVGWAVAQAVLSAWWGHEDSDSGWEAGCACAQTLRRLMTQ